jgi:predicted nucleic acid-binding protein
MLGQARMLISVPLAVEYEAVLLRPENLERAQATHAEIERLIDAVIAQSETVDIAFLWRPSLKDPADEMVLDTAVNGRADRIITFNLTDYSGAERFGIAVSRPGPAWRSLMGAQQ